jgi:hypothetical protein
MSTTKRRLNISLSPTLDHVLERLARRDRVPQATKAVDLLQVALEIEEDEVWDKLARERDTKSARFVSHRKAWA